MQHQVLSSKLSIFQMNFYLVSLFFHLIFILLEGNYIMQRQIINLLPDFPASPTHSLIKNILNSLIVKLETLEKERMLSNRLNYIHLFKQMSWALGKCSPNWPSQIQDIVIKLNSQLSNFQAKLIDQPFKKSKGFSLCGVSYRQKEQIFQVIYKRILGYQHIFFVIGIYQDRKLKQDLVEKILHNLQKTNGFDIKTMPSGKKNTQIQSEADTIIKLKQSPKISGENCNYCELFKAISVCPNGYIVKKMLNSLQDVEWIAGILYEDGKIIDKNLNEAIQNYQQGKRKNNPEAFYRLGLLSERGKYGKPLQYLKLWEEAAKLGHLQSMTDLGYLYENGLEGDGEYLIKPNPEKALQYYLRAGQKNFPRALNNLASFYFCNSKYKNDKKCMEYFQRAADASYVKSLYNLGIIHLQGEIGPQDLQKGKKLIKRSAQKGDIQAKQQYIQLILNDIQRSSEDDFIEINAYCRQIVAEQEDNPYAYYFMGVMYEGGFGVLKQPKTALLYYTKGEKHNCPEASVKLGDFFRDGLGVEQNSRQAIRHYQKAAETLPEANICIGQMYEKGYPDLKQNFQFAFNHYYIACNHQIGEGFIRIGHMYKYVQNILLKGRHVKRDEGKAQQYYARGNIQSKKNCSKLSSSSQLIQSSYFRAKK